MKLTTRQAADGVWIVTPVGAATPCQWLLLGEPGRGWQVLDHMRHVIAERPTMAAARDAVRTLLAMGRDGDCRGNSEHCDQADLR